MLFKFLSQGEIFEILTDGGNVCTAIKTEGKKAIRLDNGEEMLIHLNKTVDLPKPIKAGEYAQDVNGEALLVEEIPGERFRCDYIVRVRRDVLEDSQVVKFRRKPGEMEENAGEVYIILKQAKKAVKQAEKALKLAESMIKGLNSVR